jgi:hypothetical protein
VYYFTAKPVRPYLSNKNLFDTVLFMMIVAMVVNVIYYLHQTFIPLGSYVFESNALQSLQHALAFLHRVPVPLPHSYVQSIDMLKAHAELGAGKPASTYNGTYLFHELKLSGSYWYYYIVHFWYKMPLGTMLLFLCSIIMFFRKFRLTSFSQQYLFLLLPVIFYFIVLTFFNPFKSGLRHLLLILPLSYIGLGYLFQQVVKAKAVYKVLTGTAIAYPIISLAVYYPYIIPYTNEFVSNKKMVYRKIWDSSIDYGQSDSSIKKFVAEHPEYKRASAVPDTGKYAVLMGEMVNTYLRNANPYKWYQAFEPNGQYRYVVLLFDIRKEDLQNAYFGKADLNIIP